MASQRVRCALARVTRLHFPVCTPAGSGVPRCLFESLLKTGLSPNPSPKLSPPPAATEGPAWFHYSGRFGQTFGTDGGIDRKHMDVPFSTPDNMYR